MKRFCRKITGSILVLLTAMLLLCGCADKVYEDNYVYNDEPFDLYEIKLSGKGGWQPESDVKINYNSKLLQKKVDKAENVYVYGNPKLLSESIVALFGFDPDNYETIDEVRRYTDSENSEKKLWIDKYGCFSYQSGIEFVNTDFDYSDKKCVTMARKHLVELGLWLPDQMDEKGRVTGVSSNTSGGVTTVIEKTIKFSPKHIGGLESSGRRYVSVKLSSDLEVISIRYNWREYQSRRGADLVSVDEAVERIKEGKAKIDCSNIDIAYLSKISLTGVSVSYWDDPGDPSEAATQPVYVFSGTAKDSKGRSTIIHITVQANRFAE